MTNWEETVTPKTLTTPLRNVQERDEILFTSGTVRTSVIVVGWPRQHMRRRNPVTGTLVVAVPQSNKTFHITFEWETDEVEVRDTECDVPDCTDPGSFQRDRVHFCEAHAAESDGDWKPAAR